MVCVACSAETVGDYCRQCGAEPRLQGRYALMTALGRGGVGVTWRARDEISGDRVAIREITLQPDAIEAHLVAWREANALRALHHPNLANLREAFLAGRGRTRALWLVQDLIEGTSLAQESLAMRHTTDEVLGIAAVALDLLNYLHSQGVVYRDLKPANLLRREGDGRILLVDLSAARKSVVEASLGGHIVAGTFGYMAPEQFTGEATPATDLYGLGVTMIVLLTRMDPRAMLTGQGRLDWEPHVRVPEPVRGLLRSLLEPDPRRRAPSAAAVRARILAIREELPHLEAVEAARIPPAPTRRWTPPAPAPAEPPRGALPRAADFVRALWWSVGSLSA